MENRASTVVVVGASAGGVEALKVLVAGLSESLPAAVVVVLHVSPTAETRLPQILTRAGPLPACQADEGHPLLSGRIYVARPDRHVLVVDGRLAVVRGPHENGFRPAIDVLFRSAAAAFGRHVVAVVLSGTLADGVAGAAAVSSVGGTVVVQDPGEAIFPEMPSNTIALDHPDLVLPVERIAPAVADVVGRLSQEDAVSENGREEMSLETSYAALERSALDRPSPPGSPSAFSCPSCGGVLWESGDDDLLRFRCRVGHAFAADAVLEGQAGALEEALWTAMRALHERAELARRISARLEATGSVRGGRRFGALEREALEQAEVIRRVLLARNGDDV